MDGKTQDILYLGLAPGDGYGWGIASKYLAQELLRRIPVMLLAQMPASEWNKELPGPFFQALKNHFLDPVYQAHGTRNYGYVFFEDEPSRRSIDNARNYEIVFTGSNWCTEKLRSAGIGNAATLIQGVDHTLFYPGPEPEEKFFSIFSGGKFEYRKGQDLVLKAVKVMQERHKDVVLINCWENYLHTNVMSMADSPHIRFEAAGKSWAELMEHTYKINDLDASRIVTLPLLKNEAMRPIIARTSVGVFPNRCESGTNLVLMEYMACGKPGIVSNFSGHCDVATVQNSILLKGLSDCTISAPDGSTAKRWKEASVEEIVEALEHAYQHRDELKKLGRQAALDMQRFTWESCALNLLSAIGHKVETPHDSGKEESLRTNLSASPHDPELNRQLGEILLDSSRPGEAAQFLRKSATLGSPTPQLIACLALALLRAGRPQEAAAHYEELLAQSPNNLEILNALGLARQQAGELGAAVACFMRILSAKRDSPETLFNLANTVLAQDKPHDALRFYDTALRLRPAYPEALCNRGNTLRALGRNDEALASYEKALALDPGLCEAQINRGSVLHELERFDEARACFENVIETSPGSVPARVNLGNLRGELGEAIRALECYRSASALNPAAPDPHLFAGSTLLMLGRFAEGWREYEWRLQREELAHLRVNLPRWTQSAPASAKVLVLSEQGFGDTINFARYLPLLRARCAKLIFRSQAPLVPLLAGMKCIDELQTRGSDDSQSDADFQIPLLSLPFAFDTDETSIPAHIPYLEPIAYMSDNWRARLAKHAGNKLRIGICWGGSATNNNDRKRSITPELASTLLDFELASFFSLKKGGAQLEDKRCTDWTSELGDFAETAALINNLDLVISVDTAVAHLAGALGKPIWLLLPIVPTWRWQLNRTDSPWYPTMRIFRQEKRGDWHGPLSKVLAELSKLHS